GQLSFASPAKCAIGFDGVSERRTELTYIRLHLDESTLCWIIRRAADEQLSSDRAGEVNTPEPAVNCLPSRRFAQVPDEQDAAPVLFSKARQSVHHRSRFIRAVRVHLRAQIGLDGVNYDEPSFGSLQCILEE